MVAAEGYPGYARSGDVITGAEAEGVLHAGTRRREDGAIVSAGGRVLSVVGTGATLAAAREEAYRKVVGGAPGRLPPPHGHRPASRRGRDSTGHNQWGESGMNRARPEWPISAAFRGYGG